MVTITTKQMIVIHSFDDVFVIEGEYDMKRHQIHNGVVDDLQTCHVAVLYCDSAVSVLL